MHRLPVDQPLPVMTQGSASRKQGSLAGLPVGLVQHANGPAEQVQPAAALRHDLKRPKWRSMKNFVEHQGALVGEAGRTGGNYRCGACWCAGS